MAPLILEGETLGQKHRHFNSLVKAAAEDKSFILEEINYEDEDITNLVRVEVACARRDAAYALRVLRGGDALLVARVLRRGTWLLDAAHAHLLCPHYLHANLFPHLNARTKNKLLLFIRLNLKDAKRSEEFFNYYEHDIDFAQKFLYHCSLPFIENAVQKYADKISVTVLTRLCDKSVNILKVFFENFSSFYKLDVLQKTTFLLRKNPRECLEIFDSVDVAPYLLPKFGSKATKMLMKNCPERIISRFERYYLCIDYAIFAKYLEKKNILNFLSSLQQGGKLGNFWFRFENLKYFVKYLPKEGRYQLVKKIFIDREFSLDGVRLKEGDCPTNSSPSLPHTPDFYLWYRFAPFDTALSELQKLTLIESLPGQRNSIFMELLRFSGKNPRHIHTLLKYYRDHHINETFKFKVQFVNNLISQIHTHRLADDTWSILDDIFKSMEVYVESENKVPFCVRSIIVYNVVNDKRVPDIIENKFIFNTLNEYRVKLNEEEQNKVFDFLYNYIWKKIRIKNVTNDSEMADLIDTVTKALILLKEWNKNLIHYPNIINIIRELTNIKIHNPLEISLTPLYNVNKEFRKHLFEQSLLLHPCDEVCLNALKHDPCLLSCYKDKVDAICCNDKESMTKTLRKLKVYWAQTTAKTWANTYLQRLKQPSGTKAVTKGLCILLPGKQAIHFIQKYAPVETKIDWNSDFNQVTFKICKNIAGHMHYVRPPIQLEVVLLYAKDDYLHYALPSLNVILYNMSPADTKPYVLQFLDAPVSLQKHGIRYVIPKLKFCESKPLLCTLWNKTRNSSVKRLIVEHSFKLICSGENSSNVKEIFVILSNFIENLSFAESKVLHNMLSEVYKVPLSVGPEFFQKCYVKTIFFKQDNLEHFRYVLDIINLLEPSFVEDILLKSFDKLIDGKGDNRQFEICEDVLAAYLLRCKSEDIQIQKFKRVFIPILESYIALWQVVVKKERTFRNSLKNLLEKLVRELNSVTQDKFIIPVTLFKNIKDIILKNITLEENYIIVTEWSVAVLFVDDLQKYVKVTLQSEIEDVGGISDGEQKRSKNNKVWDKLCLAVSPILGMSCVNFFSEHIPSEYKTLYLLTTSTLWDIFDALDFKELYRYLVLKSLLSNINVTFCYYLVIGLLKRFSKDTSENICLRKEICQVIKSHPDVGVKICYYNEIDNSSDCEDNDEW